MAQKTVYVELIAETRKLRDGLKRADRQTNRLTKAFKRLGVAIAGAFTARAVINSLQKTFIETNKLVNTAKGVSFAADSYERLAFAFESVGVSADSMRIGILDLQKRLGQRGFDKFYKEAGLDPDTLRKLGPEQQFLAAITGLLKFRGDQATLVGTGGRLFEEQSGKEIARVVNQWELFNRALREYDRIGSGLDNSAIENLRELDFQAKLLTQSFEVLKRRVVVEVAPDITKAIQTMADSGAIQEITGSVVALATAMSELTKDVRFFASLVDDIDASIPDWMKFLFRNTGIQSLVQVSKVPFTELRGARERSQERTLNFNVKVEGDSGTNRRLASRIWTEAEKRAAYAP